MPDSVDVLYDNLVADLKKIIRDLNASLGSQSELRLDLIELATTRRLETRGGAAPANLNASAVAQAALDLVLGWQES